MAVLDHRLLLDQNYAIFNPLQLEASSWRDLPTTALAPRELQHQGDLMPVLLPLDRLSQTQRIDLLDRSERHCRISRKPYFSALFVSAVASERLVSHLSLQLILKNQRGGKGLFRYFDSEIFQHLTWLLTQRQMNSLLGPIAAWTWRDAQGRWQTFECDKEGNSRLRLDASQQDTLARIGLINRCLRQLRRDNHPAAADPENAPRLDTLLVDARDRHGLIDDADCCLYALQVLATNDDIHRHPQIAKRLAHGSSARTSYVAACADIDEMTLQGFAAELNATTSMTGTIA